MFAFRRARKVKVDDPISYEDHNDLVDEIARMQIIKGPGILVTQTETGQVVSAVPYSGIIGAYTPSGGIAAASADTSSPPVITSASASCQIYTVSSGVWTYNGISRDVWNDMMSGGVGGSKFILCAEAADGSLHSIAEPCT